MDEGSFRVRLKIAPQKWEVFRLLAFEGHSGAEVAQKLGMKVATVFVVRSKVQKMLQEEIRKLEEPHGERGGEKPPGPSPNSNPLLCLPRTWTAPLPRRLPAIITRARS